MTASKEDACEVCAGYSDDELNREYRQETAVGVLEAMDVDQYLIEAVRNATPTTAVSLLNSPPIGLFQVITEDLESLADGVVPEWLKYDAGAALGQASVEPATSEDLTKEQSRIWEEGFDAACKEHIRDLQRIRASAITFVEHNVLDLGIAAAKRQMAWP